MQLFTLKGLAISKFGSIQKFANALGWNRHKAQRIVNNIQSPTDEEIEKMAEVLGITNLDLFMQIFFPNIYMTCSDSAANRNSIAG